MNLDPTVCVGCPHSYISSRSNYYCNIYKDRQVVMRLVDMQNGFANLPEDCPRQLEHILAGALCDKKMEGG